MTREEFRDSAKFFAPCNLERSNAVGKALARAPDHPAEETDGRLFLLLTERRANCWNYQETSLKVSH